MSRRIAFIAFIAFAALLVTGCASKFNPPGLDTPPGVRVQSSAIAPGNGGALVAPDVLQPGDILLTSINSLQSVVIQLGTLAPVSHAVLYIGDGQIAEAVGSGVRVRSIGEVIDEEYMVVAFRVPGLGEAHAQQIRRWAESQVGTRYNTVGIVLNAPFVLNRRMCELPLVPSAVSQFCITGFAKVQLGASRDDQFFCSQFVLEAYRQAGAPITDADPRWVSPADLLHMRENDVPSIPSLRPLRYVGHLKYTPLPLITADGATAR